MSEDRRVARVMNDIAAVTNISSSAVRQAFIASTFKSWKSDPHVGGAFPFYGPGNFLDVRCGLKHDIDENPKYHKRVRITVGDHKDALGHAWIKTSLVSAIEQVDKLGKVLNAACSSTV
eukprot:TRINITY_DN7528_c0_g1_i1.p3 TRINITY_DN7528_c0_g1~~TRINITY_DN7528_c0_g1_i1.p3  ORF type:complete len:119 (+),score=15.40 TRINITY_DN7528_c0_g1_i1:783-1139(+)